jgi:hypothetical protein
MYVDYRHLLAREPVLAHAVLEQYYRSVPFPTSPHLCKLTDRFLPFMRRAVQSLVRKYEPTFLYTSASLSTNQNSSASTSSLQTRDFYIAFHNMPLTSGIRDMRMDKIGQLASISGTVTRTSEVRPELISGTFSCEMCQTTIRDVEQQFKYTEVSFWSWLRLQRSWSLIDSLYFARTLPVITETHGSSILSNLDLQTGKKSGFKKTQTRSQPVPCQDREFPRYIHRPSHLLMSDSTWFYEPIWSKKPKRATSAPSPERSLSYPTSRSSDSRESTRR